MEHVVPEQGKMDDKETAVTWRVLAMQVQLAKRLWSYIITFTVTVTLVTILYK